MEAPPKVARTTAQTMTMLMMLHRHRYRHCHRHRHRRHNHHSSCNNHMGQKIACKRLNYSILGNGIIKLHYCLSLVIGNLA